jgi:hypothetical protein
MRSMANTAFVLETEAEDSSIHRHFNHEFLDQHDWEASWVERCEDMTDIERYRYHFGNECPLALKDGVTECKSYKHNKDRYVSTRGEHFAQNYLARHAYDSSNHESNGKLIESFEEAERCVVKVDMETWDERERHRRHCESFAKKDKQMEAPPRKKMEGGGDTGGNGSSSSRGKGKGIENDDRQGIVGTNVIAT